MSPISLQALLVSPLVRFSSFFYLTHRFRFPVRLVLEELVDELLTGEIGPQSEHLSPLLALATVAVTSCTAQVVPQFFLQVSRVVINAKGPDLVHIFHGLLIRPARVHKLRTADFPEE